MNVGLRNGEGWQWHARHRGPPAARRPKARRGPGHGHGFL